MKKILLFAFLFCSFSAFAQYPAQPTTKQELGRQTTGDGLIYRGSGAPAYTPSNNRNAWIYYDTTNNRLYKSRLGSWSLMVQDTSAFNEIQMPYIVNDTLYLTQNVTGEPLTRYVNRVWPITNLSDTTSITGENQGDVAFVTGGTAVAFRGATYWSPFSGGGSYDDWTAAADSGTPAVISDGETVTYTGGAGVNTAISGNTVTINAEFDSTAIRVSDVANVKIYGALGNGGDATTAFQNAIASGKTVYVPPGRYLISTALTLQAGQTMYGDGDKSIVAVTANISVFTVTIRSTIHNLRIVGDKGGADTSQRGIFIDGGASFNTSYENVIAGVFLDSLGGDGIYITRVVVNHQGNLIANCVIKNCVNGINLDTRGEYTKVTGCSVFLCTIGIRIKGGNSNVSSCIISDNTTGVSVLSGDNSDHGVVSTSTLNHNTTAILVGNIALGFTFSACQIWSSSTAVSLQGCTNVYFNGGAIEQGIITATSALNCFFTNMQFSGTVTKSVGSSGVFFIDNYQGTTKGVYPSTVPGDYALRTDGVNTHTYVPVERPPQTTTTIVLDGTDVITTSKNNKIFHLVADAVTTSNLSFAGGIVGEYLLHITGVTDSLVFYFADAPNGPSGNLLDSCTVYYDGFYRMYYDEIAYTINIPGNEYIIPFAPTDVTGLKLWLDAADAATITTGVNGVTLWEDKSGSNNDFSATSTTCPDVVTAGKNGLDVIDFNNEFMQLAATTNRDSFRFLHATTSTVFIVVKPSTVTSPEVDHDFIANKILASSGRGYLLGYADAGATEDRFVGQVSNGTQQVVLNYDNGKIDPDDFNVLIYSVDVAAATAARGLYYIDAGAVNATNTQTSTASSSDAVANLFIGQNSGNANRMAGGQICEILIYNSVLSTVNRELVRDYLNTKWAVY